MGTDPCFFRFWGHRRLWPRNLDRHGSVPVCSFLTCPYPIFWCVNGLLILEIGPVPQKVWCKRNFPNLVLRPLFVRPVVKHYPYKRLKLCGPYRFFDESVPNFLSCKRPLRCMRNNTKGCFHNQDESKNTGER